MPVEHLLVVCDDFNLPLGKLRVRAKGSHGGQNGLRNIQEQLGTDAYPRLRIGVGQPDPGDAVDHVLSRFKPGERAAVEDAVAAAAQAVLVWVRRGIEACMNQANGPADAEKPKKEPKEKPPAEPRREAERGRRERRTEGRRTERRSCHETVAPLPAAGRGPGACPGEPW